MNVYLHFTKYILHEIMKLLLKKTRFNIITKKFITQQIFKLVT